MYWEPVEAYRPMTKKKRVAPEWEYKIRAVKVVNMNQVAYIRKHESELEGKIRDNGRPTLEILGIL